MKIVNDFTGDYQLGLTPYINKSFEGIDDDEDMVIFNGFSSLRNRSLQQKYLNANRRCLIDVWSPCEFAQIFNLELYRYFTEVYCVCKYTCEVANNYFGEDKFIYFPFCFTNYSSNVKKDKDYDICYFGGIHVAEQDKAMHHLRKFKFQFFSFGPHGSHADCANPVVSSDKKLKVISNCKISLCYNWISVNATHRSNMARNGIIHPAFNSQNNSHIAPQFKVRIHEAASSGSLILCRKDEWNVIEDFYEPDKEFIYFNHEDELENKIREILENWDKYERVVENAYKRSQGYTVENFYPFMKTKDQSLVTWRNNV